MTWELGYLRIEVAYLLLVVGCLKPHSLLPQPYCTRDSSYSTISPSFSASLESTNEDHEQLKITTEVLWVFMLLLLATTSAASAIPKSQGWYHLSPLSPRMSYSSKISDARPETPPPNTVSWQSIFWALSALALNAMTQPSILDRKFPQSNLLFPARSSPFVCLADSLDVLFGLFTHVWSGRSIRDAAYQVNLGRLRDRLDQETVPLTPTAVEQHPFGSLVLFLSTMSQFVKLCGFQGILWAKVGAATYLFSYILLAGTSWLSYDYARSVDHLPSHRWYAWSPIIDGEIAIIARGLFFYNSCNCPFHLLLFSYF